MRLAPVGCRVARPASFRWTAAKTLFHIAIFSFIFLIVLPWLVVVAEHYLFVDRFRFHGSWNEPLGIVLFLTSLSLSLTSAYVMVHDGKGTPLPVDAPRALVTRGPYRWVRNPMAVGGIMQGIAIGIYLGSFFGIIYSIIGGILWHTVIRPWEEADLEHRFGEPYQHYRNHVRCWLPHRGSWKS